MVPIAIRRFRTILKTSSNQEAGRRPITEDGIREPLPDAAKPANGGKPSKTRLKRIPEAIRHWEMSMVSDNET